MKRLACFLLLAGGCAAPYVAVPLAAHPSAAANGPSVGGSAGAVYGWVSEGGNTSSELVVPYSEGWLRTQAGSGQLELHLAPNVAGLGYRFDLQPMSSGFGAAIEPMVAGGYFRESGTDTSNTDSSDWQLAIAGSARFDLLFPSGTNGGFFYVSPVLGYTTVRLGGTNSSSLNEDHVDILTLGAAVGINLGGRPGMSLELSFHRLDDQTDAGANPIYLLAPSLGFQI